MPPSSAMSVAALEQQRADIAALSREIQRQRRALAQKRRRQERREEGPQEMLAVACILERTPESERNAAALAFREQQDRVRRRKRREIFREADSQAGQAAAVPGAGYDNTGASPSATAAPWALQRARDFCEERSLAGWLASVNDSVGVAPGTATVWAARQSIRDGSETPLEAVARSCGWSSRRARQWVRRWRRRWRHRLGRPRPGTVLPPTELRRKAHRVSGSAGFLNPKVWSQAICGEITRGPFSEPPSYPGREARPRFGDQFPDLFFCTGNPRKMILGSLAEAEATLQVDRFLTVKCCPPGQATLRINIDESSIRLWPGADPGTIAASTKGVPRREVVANVSLRGQRGAFSFIAVVCDDAAVQKELPQFLVASERLLCAGVATAFLAAPTRNYVLLRRPSAWLDAGGLCVVLRHLADTVHRVAPNRHTVLSMDVCPVHVSSQVLRQLARCRLHFCPIAAHMTRWLQPADVGVFRPFKQRIRQLHQQEQVVQGKAELDISTVLHIIDRATADVIRSRPWGKVFRLCGLADSPPTSRRFATALGQESPLAFTAEVPSLQQLQALLPRRRFVPVEHLFPLLMPDRALASRGARRPPDSQPRAHPGTADMSGTPDMPWVGRTRSTSHLTASADASSQLGRGSSVGRPSRAVPIAAARRPPIR